MTDIVLGEYFVDKIGRHIVISASIGPKAKGSERFSWRQTAASNARISYQLEDVCLAWYVISFVSLMEIVVPNEVFVENVVLSLGPFSRSSAEANDLGHDLLEIKVFEKSNECKVRDFLPLLLVGESFHILCRY